jgi:hypothetical protein
MVNIYVLGITDTNSVMAGFGPIEKSSIMEKPFWCIGGTNWFSAKSNTLIFRFKIG